MREPVIKGTPGEPPEVKKPGREAAAKSDPDEKLRPQRLSEIVGQRSVAERLAIALSASQEAKRTASAHPLRRSSRTRQDDVRDRAPQRAWRRAQHHERPRARQEDGRDALPHERHRGLDPLHRRDPSPAEDGRGIHLSRDGGFSSRRRSRRRDVGPHDQSSAQEVHDHRRNHPQRHAFRPAPRPVPHARAPRVLRRRRPGARSSRSTRRSFGPRSPPKPPGSSPSGVEGLRGWPTPASAGSATTRPPAPMARSPSKSRAMPSTCRRSTSKGWTSKTAATSRHSINVFQRRPDRSRSPRRDDEHRGRHDHRRGRALPSSPPLHRADLAGPRATPKAYATSACGSRRPIPSSTHSLINGGSSSDRRPPIVARHARVGRRMALPSIVVRRKNHLDPIEASLVPAMERRVQLSSGVGRIIPMDIIGINVNVDLNCVPRHDQARPCMCLCRELSTTDQPR